MPQQQFRFVIDAIAIAVFARDDLQTRRNLLPLPFPAQLTADDAQAGAEGVVRKLLEAFGILQRAGKMAGGAARQILGQETIEMLLQRGPVRGRGFSRTGCHHQRHQRSEESTNDEWLPMAYGHAAKTST